MPAGTLHRRGPADAARLHDARPGHVSAQSFRWTKPAGPRSQAGPYSQRFILQNEQSVKIAQTGTTFLSARRALQYDRILRHITFVVAQTRFHRREIRMPLSAEELSHPRIFVLHENTPWVEPLRRELAAIDA